MKPSDLKPNLTNLKPDLINVKNNQGQIKDLQEDIVNLTPEIKEVNKNVDFLSNIKGAIDEGSSNQVKSAELTKNFELGLENDLKTHSFYDIIKSDWYEKTLIESWEKTHHLHLSRCYLSCGDFAKRKVIK